MIQVGQIEFAHLETGMIQLGKIAMDHPAGWYDLGRSGGHGSSGRQV